MSTHHVYDFFIQWHLTERCNLRCIHCYQAGKNTGEMSLPEIKESINEIADTLSAWKTSYDIDFSPSFNITGGEPFLRRDLFDVLTEIRRRGFDIYILTNGTIVDENKAKKLFELGIKGVQVSIEGPEKIHESIRGKGSFSLSGKGIKNLLDAGLTVTLNVTLSRLNAGSFMDILKLSSNLGVQRLGFSRLVPSGRGKALIKEMLSTGAIKRLYEKIFSTDSGSIEIVTGDPVASQYRQPDKHHKDGTAPLGGCAAGISGLTILPDGTLVPCRRLHIPIGNIRKDSLREVWATSDVLEALRDRNRYNGKCRVCKRWASCRGCRAIAHSYSLAQGKNDLLGEDPQCFIE